jgi:CubicO group peptidase (beta-lactamase class C family)
MKRAINLFVMAALFLGSYGTPTCVTPKSIERSRPTSRQPAAQSPDYWPTKEWRSSTPEQQGVDSAQLANALTAIKQHDIRTHSLLLVRNGYVILDAYFFPFDKDNLHDLASVTKSVTSTLVGIAIDQRKVRSVNESVANIFPRRTIANGDERKAKLTLESLLTMTSGLACHPEENELTLRQMIISKDWLQFMLDLPMTAEPGQNFVYCSGGMHLLSGVISETTKMSALAFARSSLFEPLGIHDAVWPVDPNGNNHGWGDLHLHPRDMAKLGYLWLNHGMWDGKQIVSTDWVTNSTRVHARTSSNSDYGYGWWVRPKDKLYEAVGRGGQRITVLPELNLVAVMTGGGFEPGDVGALLIPAIKSDRALPANPFGAARLAVAIKEMARAPSGKPADAMPKTATAVSGQTFVLDQNPIGLKEMSFVFTSKDAASVSIGFVDGRREVHAIGLNGIPLITPNGRFGLPVAVKGFWQDERTFVLDYDEVGNINHFRFKVNFRENAVGIELSEATVDVTVTFSGHRK